MKINEQQAYFIKAHLTSLQGDLLWLIGRIEGHDPTMTNTIDFLKTLKDRFCDALEETERDVWVEQKTP